MLPRPWFALIDFELLEALLFMDVLMDLVVVLAIVLGLYGPVKGFVLAFCAFTSLRTGHQ